MALILILAAGTVAVIWLAALLLVIRDKCIPSADVVPADEQSAVLAAMLEQSASDTRPMPVWKKALVILFALLVVPTSVILLCVIVAPFAVVFVARYFYEWLRSKWLGIPMAKPCLPGGLELGPDGRPLVPDPSQPE